MAMKYVAAYLMNVLGGKDSPSAADVKRTLQAVGADVDAEVLDTLIKAMQGKTVHEVIAAGMEKLQKVPTGGAAAAPAAAAGAAAGGSSEPKEEKKEEPEEEEDADMGFSLFD
ncbi:60S acidic ribosomal protein P2 [Cyclospora cayetanensis]|uniref:Acidic ribosomal protein P2 n=1 Tax=Cyclospora cayetanensis TaxID=88456 RepID=Q8ISJ6_9EIME|nr:60S acidic ribosomal protein P2 [Cyclospora cayetanensis]AAL50112.1 acidic ribosomal protein P2 [Cyclospora cayetanensis]